MCEYVRLKIMLQCTLCPRFNSKHRLDSLHLSIYFHKYGYVNVLTGLSEVAEIKVRVIFADYIRSLEIRQELDVESS